MSVKAAVERDLARLAERDPEIAESGLAASALALAEEMDARNSATSKSMCARALVETLEKLTSLAPAELAKDAVDEIANRRAKRLSA